MLKLLGIKSFCVFMFKCYVYFIKFFVSCFEFKECKILGNYILEEMFDIGF